MQWAEDFEVGLRLVPEGVVIVMEESWSVRNVPVCNLSGRLKLTSVSNFSPSSRRDSSWLE